MRILADDAIPCLAEAFGGFGEVVPTRARDIDRARVRDADVLLVRTVTRVDARLLAGSRVRFVGTATSGSDHVDVEGLRRAGIEFADAAGCNAQAVAEWVLAAMVLVAARADPLLLGAPVGVIGFGAVGRRLTRLLRNIGCTVLAYDPPLHERVQAGAVAGDDPLDALARAEQFVDAYELLGRCRTVTFHVPLVERGPLRTWHMMDAKLLANLREDALVINTSRGGVIDDDALEVWLRDRRGRAALDVWEGEPMLRPSLVSRVDLASPHVAGYTLEGKIAGTALVHRALARWLGVPERFDAAAHLGPDVRLAADITGAKDELEALARVLAAACPIERDHSAVKLLAARSMGERPTAFEAMRRGYPLRRELAHYDASEALASASETLRARAQAVGLRL
jgi:erythronate-4-phosphate dehydrogenase